MTTTVTTKVEKATNLVSTSNLIYVRPMDINITASLLKPNTKMYAFFGGVSIDAHVKPFGGQLGDGLITDVNGNLKATFTVPSMTFTTGEKELLLLDTPIYGADTQTGAAVVKAKATFSSSGTIETYQTTETTIITTTKVVPPPNYDPLAQSFFTYGVSGGCYITSIDLFFFSKDVGANVLPAWVEIREMVNGYPCPNLAAPHAISIVNAEDINIYSQGSTPVATKFKFDKLVYLKQDSDYCFVVRSNSNRYNIWTSKLGEVSNETGKVVFDQPYMGSLFKSENNITWTAEQTEDIKFVLYKAEFDTGVESNIVLSMEPNMVSMETEYITTIQDSNIVVVEFPFKHGQTVGSKLDLVFDENGIFNGIPAASLTGEREVKNIISEYILAFESGDVATSSGRIFTGGNIKAISVTNQGSGYDDNNPPAVNISGSIGLGAQAKAIVRNGKLVDIVVTNEGSGYFGDVSVSIGSGNATAKAITTPKFLVNTNRIYHNFKPVIDRTVPNGTMVGAKLTTTYGEYEGGNLISYDITNRKIYDVAIDNLNKLDSNLLIASKTNEQLMMGGNKSTLLEVKLKSNNKNVSPVIDLKNSRVVLRTNSINNQKSENIKSTNSSGIVLTGVDSGVKVINGGSGYSSAPLVEITGTGTGATAIATISGGQVVSVNVTNGGSGYYGIARVRFVGGNPTNVATGIVVLSDYNSELKTGFGNALTRYVSKKQTLNNVASGVRVYVTAFSNASSSFEVYMKTSLSTSEFNHDEQEWQLLKCDIDRNKSRNSGEYLEYEFYTDNIDAFDVYSLKFVLRTTTPWEPPVINNYRAILVA